MKHLSILALIAVSAGCANMNRNSTGESLERTPSSTGQEETFLVSQVKMPSGATEAGKLIGIVDREKKTINNPEVIVNDRKYRIKAHTGLAEEMCKRAFHISKADHSLGYSKEPEVMGNFSSGSLNLALEQGQVNYFEGIILCTENPSGGE